MAFIVEDGSIVAGANSLASLAYADQYNLDRGNATWAAAVNSAKEAALVNATDYLQQKYTGSWKGSLVEYDQPLDWPRSDICNVDYQTIPERVKQAVCILAQEALSDILNPSVSPQGQIKFKKVDVIEVEYFASFSTSTKRPAVDGLLRPYLSGLSGINVPVVRV